MTPLSARLSAGRSAGQSTRPSAGTTAGRSTRKRERRPQVVRALKVVKVVKEVTVVTERSSSPYFILNGLPLTFPPTPQNEPNPQPQPTAKRGRIE